MKPSSVQIAVAYLAAILQMLVVFHKPIGLSDTTADILQVISLACWVAFFVLWKRQKSAAAAGTEPSAAHSNSRLQRIWNNKSKRLWLIVAMFAVVSVASAFYGPYTVENLSFPQSVISSVVTFVVGVAIVLFVWRRQRR